MNTLFPGTREHRQEVEGIGIFARVGGAGPPLLLVHGFPQTHAMWHRLAPVLMQHFTCVMPDLRGYGRSACPPNTYLFFALLQFPIYTAPLLVGPLARLILRRMPT